MSSHRKGVYNPKAVVLHAALLPQTCVHWGRFLAAATRRCLGRFAVPVWLAVLTDQRPVIGLVGRYPTSCLMGRTPVPARLAPFLRACGHGAYAVFAAVSRRYSPRWGWSRTCSSAVRHACAEAQAFDLHALGTPPALILSQDQTRQMVTRVIQPPGMSFEATHHSSVGQVLRPAATKNRGGVATTRCWSIGRVCRRAARPKLPEGSG